MAENYRRPTPKSQREISEGLQTPSDVRMGNPNDASNNKQFPPENEANIPLIDLIRCHLKMILQKYFQ